MKLKFIYMFFGLAAFGMLALSNSSGRASFSGQGATTAPGEGTVCTSCHNGGNYGASVNVRLKDKVSGEPITEYTPGETYDVEVIIGTSTTPGGYGFQVLALKDMDNSSVSTWANNVTMNTKFTNAGGRQYFEQGTALQDSIMMAEWTAPASGTGSVTFYAVGNAVDKTGTSANDQAVTNEITFTEATTSTSSLAKLGIRINTFPNPTVDMLNLSLNTEASKALTINIYNLAGNRMQGQNVMTQSGENQYRFDVASYSSGIYFLEISDGINQTATRFVKY
jgi:hypothetical protein